MCKIQVAVKSCTDEQVSNGFCQWVHGLAQTNFLFTLRHVHLHMTAHVTDRGRTTKEAHSQLLGTSVSHLKSMEQSYVTKWYTP